MAIFSDISLILFFDSLTVTPEVLQRQAEKSKKSVYQLKSRMSELEQIMNRTKSYWIGEAGDAHRSYYFEQEEYIQKLFARLEEDISDLENIASVYTKTEREVSSIAGDLPSDVII